MPPTTLVPLTTLLMRLPCSHSLLKPSIISTSTLLLRASLTVPSLMVVRKASFSFPKVHCYAMLTQHQTHLLGLGTSGKVKLAAKARADATKEVRHSGCCYQTSLTSSQNTKPVAKKSTTTKAKPVAAAKPVPAKKPGTKSVTTSKADTTRATTKKPTAAKSATATTKKATTMRKAAAPKKTTATTKKVAAAKKPGATKKTTTTKKAPAKKVRPFSFQLLISSNLTC